MAGKFEVNVDALLEESEARAEKTKAAKTKNNEVFDLDIDALLNESEERAKTANSKKDFEAEVEKLQEQIEGFWSDRVYICHARASA